jgi:hypothetical protein
MYLAGEKNDRFGFIGIFIYEFTLKNFRQKN